MTVLPSPGIMAYCVLGHGMALWEPSCSGPHGMLLCFRVVLKCRAYSWYGCILYRAWCSLAWYHHAVLLLLHDAVLYPMAWRYCILWHGGIVSYGTVTSVALQRLSIRCHRQCRKYSCIIQTGCVGIPYKAALVRSWLVSQSPHGKLTMEFYH